LADKLTNRRGESLLESIVSLVLFAVLLSAVTAVISLAFRQTARSVELAGVRQDAFNTLVLERFEGQGSLTLRGAGGDIEVKIPVAVGEIEGLTAFYPNSILPADPPAEVVP